MSKPMETSGSTSTRIVIRSISSIDAFFDRDSVIGVREIMHNDGTLMREQLTRMNPNASSARLESEVQELMQACLQAEG